MAVLQQGKRQPSPVNSRNFQKSDKDRIKERLFYFSAAPPPIPARRSIIRAYAEGESLKINFAIQKNLRIFAPLFQRDWEHKESAL